MIVVVVVVAVLSLIDIRRPCGSAAAWRWSRRRAIMILRNTHPTPTRHLLDTDDQQ